ncbi:phosphotransferase family protein [Phytoactinopolyspora halophila]|nr:aminoglycoside phosphotransferase family protein [Phytoactinopolyspora halophila]
MASGLVEPVGEDGVPEWLVESVQRMGLAAAPGERVWAKPLTGGVSSDVYEVAVGARRMCVKRPLETLRVSASWHAPIERGRREEEWLRFAAGVHQDVVPRVLGHDPEHNAFAMELLDQHEFPTWKSQLLEGQADPAVAAALGRQLAGLHRASAASAEVMRQFADQRAFDALRVDPFYRAVLRMHPEVEAELQQVIVDVLEPRAVIHGDVSPKNILVGAHRVVLLDAECAAVGDPAFDLAFCLTHLVLKSVRRPGWSQRYLALARDFLASYRDGLPADDEERVLASTVRQMGALLIARIDGKSPIEYLTSPQRATARQLGIDLLRQPPGSPLVVFGHASGSAEQEAR